MKRILLDECLPQKLKQHLGGDTCSTVSELQWSGKKNGELLRLAEEAGFEVFVTLDRGIVYQQNLSSRRLAIVVVRTKSSRLADLVPRVGDVLNVVATIRDGEIVVV